MGAADVINVLGAVSQLVVTLTPQITAAMEAANETDRAKIRDYLDTIAKHNDDLYRQVIDLLA